MSAPAREMLSWLARAEDTRHVALADVRPEYSQSVRNRDRVGREEGHWMGGLTYATYAAQVGIRTREVPGDFWALTITEDGYPCAEVSCPCGGTPEVETLAPMVACDGCDRRFFFDGSSVWAFNTPGPSPDDATGVPS